MSLVIAYSDPGGVGYHPVLHMVRLAAELMEGQLLLLPRRESAAIEKVAGILRRRSRSGTDQCLLVCPSPSALRSFLQMDGWRVRFETVVAWVFDSFWCESIPRSAVLRRHFDRIFVTEIEDLQRWRSVTGVEVDWLPWGSDVLRLGSDGSTRDIDLLRLGRQPPAWDDDEATRRACQERGVVFHGRPEARDDASENEALVMRTCARAKFTLSFSNSVSPGVQTHPTRQYITARWVDALGAGATVAGVPPATPVVDSLFWPGALLELPGVGLEPGLSTLENAIRSWSPMQAIVNHRFALQRLDWRWRFKTLAAALGRSPEALSREIDHLGRRVASLAGSSREG